MIKSELDAAELVRKLFKKKPKHSVVVIEDGSIFLAASSKQKEALKKNGKIILGDG